MSARLEEHMQVQRLLQACGSKALGPILPDDILNQLTAAVAADDHDAVRALLDEHFPDRTQRFPGTYNIHELTPVLSQAARNDQVDVMKELFVPYPFSYQTAEFVAREATDVGAKNVLLLLLEHGWDINKRIHPGLNVLETLLCHGAQGAQERDMVMWLLAHGASLNERPRHMDLTGMSHAVEHASPDLVRELADRHGGDVRRGQLLHYALRRESQTGSQPLAARDVVEMLGLLLERGAPLNQTLYADDQTSSHNYRQFDHGTPLHEAARMGHVEVVRYLLAQGADTNVASTKSKTKAVEWAEKAGHKDVVALLRSSDPHKL